MLTPRQPLGIIGPRRPQIDTQPSVDAELIAIRNALATALVALSHYADQPGPDEARRALAAIDIALGSKEEKGKGC